MERGRGRSHKVIKDNGYCIFKKNHAKFDTVSMFLKSQLNVDVVKEYRFAPPRLWKCDYAILQYKIAVEVEGGAFKVRRYVSKRTGQLVTTVGGRHNSAKGFIADMEKYNAYTLLGWSLLRYTPQQILTMQTINDIMVLIDTKKEGL